MVFYFLLQFLGLLLIMAKLRPQLLHFIEGGKVRGVVHILLILVQLMQLGANRVLYYLHLGDVE